MGNKRAVCLLAHVKINTGSSKALAHARVSLRGASVDDGTGSGQRRRDTQGLTWEVLATGQCSAWPERGEEGFLGHARGLGG